MAFKWLSFPPIFQSKTEVLWKDIMFISWLCVSMRHRFQFQRPSLCVLCPQNPTQIQNCRRCKTEVFDEWTELNGLDGRLSFGWVGRRQRTLQEDHLAKPSSTERSEHSLVSMLWMVPRPRAFPDVLISEICLRSQESCALDGPC